MIRKTSITEPSPDFHGFFKNLGRIILTNLKTSIKLLSLPIKCVEAKLGIGIGLGGAVEIPLGGGLSHKKTSTVSVEYSRGEIDVRSTTSEECGESFLGIDSSREAGFSHSLLDEKCTCKDDFIFSGPKCPANVDFLETSNTIGFSVAAYIGCGFECSIGVSTEYYLEQKDVILNEYDKVKKSFKLF